MIAGSRICRLLCLRFWKQMPRSAITTIKSVLTITPAQCQRDC
jgi:hypothetical protein